MPQSLEIPVLTVDANVIHKVDTANPENLFSMWTVFAKCRDSVAHGRRLENLSWRLWNRETFCCENGEVFVSSSATSQPRDIQYPRGVNDDELPQLSGSVDSVADEEAVDLSSEQGPLDIVRPRILRQDSCASSRSRGRERHITSDELEKMVVQIMDGKAPLEPLEISLAPCVEKPSCPPDSEHSGSTTDESPQTSENNSPQSLPSEPEQPVPEEPTMQTIVTRGFSTSPMPTCRITSPAASSASRNDAIPLPTEAPAPQFVQPKKQAARFALGGSGSCSSGSDNSYSPEKVEIRKQVPAKSKMFQVGVGSSDEDGSLKVPRILPRATSMINTHKKTASFNNEVVTQTFESSAISDSEESEYLDESAIDDDEDDWEEDESAEESGRSSIEEKIHFKRVDSTANLTSRRSLLTLALAGNTGLSRAQKFSSIASQSTSAIPRTRAALNGPSVVASPNDSDDAPLTMKSRGPSRAPPMRPITEIPRSQAQPINAMAMGMHHQAAFSPRTTRRNMLATELTESLRRNLLHERSQKTSTANAVLKRRHTSHDVANLKQYPERPYMKRDNGPNNQKADDKVFDKNAFTGYHAQGW
ncbi:hypothetical protein QBC40DRAFT_106311 [Triangularia verruculosa]|uniref:Nitrogen regulatory protein areA GATA-like domain-containing protein n=1 Tax=Triangularia verruculosa TaxID=2587418 RepID=A0AAN6XDD3_9PEZI|nr:hypothetical protein QBC40DRAFT_106311 [Triangularia verruculosa]